MLLDFDCLSELGCRAVRAPGSRRPALPYNMTARHRTSNEQTATVTSLCVQMWCFGAVCCVRPPASRTMFQGPDNDTALPAHFQNRRTLMHDDVVLRMPAPAPLNKCTSLLPAAPHD